MKKSKIFYTIFILSAVFIAGVDVFFCITPFGSKIRHLIRPPVFVIESYPSFAYSIIRNKKDEITAEGVTPLYVRKIPEGLYTVSLAKQGYDSVSRIIEVSGNNAAISGGICRIQQTRTLLFTIPLQTTVALYSYPADADIIINKQPLDGKTPATMHLDCGKQVFSMTKKGFEDLSCVLDFAYPIDGKEQDFNRDHWKLYVEVHQDKTVYYLKGVFFKTISFYSRPPGASVFLNEGNILLGKTPLESLKITAGAHILRFVLPGYQDLARHIAVDGPFPGSVSVVFNKIVAFSAYEKEFPGKDIHARVTIPGTSITDRITPFSMDVPGGRYTAVFSKKPAYKDTAKTFDAGLSDAVTAALERGDSQVDITAIDRLTKELVAGASVSVDGKEAGFTDTAGRWQGNCSAGTHVITVSGVDGYEKARHNIRLTGSGGETLDIPLERVKDGTVIVDSRPYFEGAGIYIDGEYKGETVKKISGLSRYMHTVSIRHAQLAHEVATPVVFEKKNETIVLTLDAEGHLGIKK